ncbi:MAG TPA: hypothetical protein VHJ59_08400, partial [Nitrososphaera sp.]|nr:hypothetical protein [Nitrososphaera sp.]
VVYIDGGMFYLDPRYSHGFKLEACHGASCILHKNAVYLKTDFLAWLDPTFHKMIQKYLLSEI